MKLIVNTDGASRGNPGKAAYGFIIKNENGLILHEESETIGIATNNIAEYTAVLKAFEYIINKLNKKLSQNIEIITDSQLVVMQLSGLYKVKNLALRSLFEKIKILEYELGFVTYRNVPREQNYIADKLANQALDR
jgi:ribonuclease HI